MASSFLENMQNICLIKKRSKLHFKPRLWVELSDTSIHQSANSDEQELNQTPFSLQLCGKLYALLFALS
jgi:hypothetical protein